MQSLYDPSLNPRSLPFDQDEDTDINEMLDLEQELTNLDAKLELFGTPQWAVFAADIDTKRAQEMNRLMSGACQSIQEVEAARVRIKTLQEVLDAPSRTENERTVLISRLQDQPEAR